ncbi:uncharacterized protein LOC131639278 isoform X2 [Vicia villosa]|uniref:uncharacterized protein LOC131639278 isoform X2 n=1 Tax=Vicia villosa TaxID=3911 RepID=UPI00273CE994|nr:uncharacterized protein LOC131639278 isoform X2 [Vicia villosa]
MHFLLTPNFKLSDALEFVYCVPILCLICNMQVVVKAYSIYHKDTEVPPCEVDDMTKLAYLHEHGVLSNLRSRYEINEIYTYTGNILIAVNPFIKLPHLYDSHMMAQYIGAAFGEISPHPFVVADAAYRLMINDGISHSILVSGETGAGKTESTKLLMRYLAYMGGRAAVAEEREEDEWLKKKDEGGLGSTFLKIAGAATAAAAVVGGLYSVLNQPQVEGASFIMNYEEEVILKVDGSLKDGKAGCGGYLSSASEKWTCDFAYKLDLAPKASDTDLPKSSKTERQAILRGLIWIKGKGKMKLLVLSDNEWVLDSLCGAKEDEV